MIKYDLTNINKWYNGSRNIVKCYHGTTNAFDLTGGGEPTPPTPTGQTPCYAVTNDISQYQSTDFVDVYDTTADKWYKLNNLNEYEEYGIYGSGRSNTTYYEGKLTIDGDYEYIYSGNSWVNLGEVSGGTGTLPNVPFTVNYNAKNYNPSTYTIPMTNGQLNNMDAVITGATNLIVDHHEDGYIELTGSTSSLLRSNITNTSVDQYFNRDANNPNLTIICKAYTPGSSTEGSVIVNREGGNGNYNWMYRHKSNRLTLHGTSEQGSIAVSNTVPNICSARIDSNKQLTYNNYTQGTTSTYSGTFTYGNKTTSGATLFAGYNLDTSEQWRGVFYWVYMSQNTLTDEQVQQVIDYNEGDGGSPTYPEYYDEIAEPPMSVTFATMADALAYQCPYVGLRATIAGDNYVFNSNYEWEEVTSRLPVGYTEVEYIQNTGTSYLDIAFVPNQDTRVVCEMQMVTFSNFPRLWGAGAYNSANGLMIDYDPNQFQVSWLGKTSWTNYSSISTSSYAYQKREYDLNKNSIYIDGTLVGSNTYTTRTASDNLGVFTYIGSGRPSSSSYWGQEHFKGKMFSFKVYGNGTLVRDLVPCKRDADNEVGAYDIVNDVFYTVPTGYTTDKLIAGNPV